MAEIEIGAMVRQCLNRRIPDRDSLIREVGAWQEQRNRESVRVDWRFTTDDAASGSSPSIHQSKVVETLGRVDNSHG